MTRLGGDVIGKEVENVGNTEILSFERLMMEKPDVIFIQSAPERDENILQGLYDHPAFRQVPAVLNKRVYTVPFILFDVRRCVSVMPLLFLQGTLSGGCIAVKRQAGGRPAFCLPQA